MQVDHSAFGIFGHDPRHGPSPLSSPDHDRLIIVTNDHFFTGNSARRKSFCRVRAVILEAVSVAVVVFSDDVSSQDNPEFAPSIPIAPAAGRRLCCPPSLSVCYVRGHQAAFFNMPPKAVLCSTHRVVRHRRVFQEGCSHSNPATTANMYADVTVENMRDGVDGLYNDNRHTTRR